MKRKYALFFISLTIAIVASCAPEIELSDYDQTCVVDSDCTTAYEGDVCKECGASNGAINKNDRERYYNDLQELKKFCIINNGWFMECDGWLNTICVNGKCELKQSI